MDKETMSYQPQSQSHPQPHVPYPENEIDDIPPPSYNQILNGDSDADPDPEQNIAVTVPFFNDLQDTELPSLDNREIIDNKHVPLSTITEEEARNILLTYAQNKNNNISQKAVKKMTITNIEYHNVHAYVLETFTQKRQSSWEFKKFTGGRIDDQSFGTMPDVWSFQPASQAEMFETLTEDFVIPRSEYIQPCHRCAPAATRGCYTCGGNNKLKYYLRCRLIWKNNKTTYLSKPTILPNKLLESASGDFVYNVTGESVRPINYIQCDEISAASENLIELHRDKFKCEKLIAQRAHIRIIPIRTVHYTYADKTNKYYIYGNDYQIHSPSFPNSTCSLM